MLYTVSNRDIDNIKEAQKIGNKIDNGTITKPAIAIIKIMELMNIGEANLWFDKFYFTSMDPKAKFTEDFEWD